MSWSWENLRKKNALHRPLHSACWNALRSIGMQTAALLDFVRSLDVELGRLSEYLDAPVCSHEKHSYTPSLDAKGNASLTWTWGRPFSSDLKRTLLLEERESDLLFGKRPAMQWSHREQTVYHPSCQRMDAICSWSLMLVPRETARFTPAWAPRLSKPWSSSCSTLWNYLWR